MTIFTATRCTTLVKLPVALSGGSRAYCAPEPGAKAWTWPVITWPGKVSTRTCAFCPTAMWVNWVSL